MFKRLTCLILALLLAIGIGTTALADNTLSLIYVRAQDLGFLRVIASTPYTAPADMNFTAKTENGDLEIANTSVMRNEGTSWFVIMEYNYYYDNSHYAKTQNRVLKSLADSISDKDNGALVRCDKDRVINLEAGDMLRASLEAKHTKTKPEELLATIKDVQQYINEHPGSLKANVVMVIVTGCPHGKVSESMIKEIGSTFEINKNITTHVIVTAAEGSNKQDRELGRMLAERAKTTAGGTGYLTEKLTEEEADKGVQRVNDAERNKILMILDPKMSGFLGHKLTLSQTTSDGKLLTAELELLDTLYVLWENSFNERAEVEGPVETPSMSFEPYAASDPGSVWTGGGMTESDDVKKNEGISTELLVGIIAGVAVLALVAALLITRANKNKKSQKAAAPVYVSGSSASSSSGGGTTVTLTGANGSVLKGQMKGGKLTVGRNGAKAMLTVPSDGKLSGLHATFTKQGNQMMITDNGSTNGTKLNGTKIPAAAPTPVHQNDTVTLGSTTYTISWR